MGRRDRGQGNGCNLINGLGGVSGLRSINVRYVYLDSMGYRRYCMGATQRARETYEAKAACRLWPNSSFRRDSDQLGRRGKAHERRINLPVGAERPSTFYTWPAWASFEDI